MSRRMLVLALPAVVPVSMAGAFRALGRRMGPVAAYNTGFAVYWIGWCLVVPVWILGPARARRVVLGGRRPSPGEAAVLAVPVLGAAVTELLPRRHGMAGRVAAVMVGTAGLNALGEELLWRGLFVEEFPDDPVAGLLWPLAGFSLWHLAPQIVLPSARGRWPFVAGAALVGASSAWVARRHGGLRAVLVAHLLTDVCGVRPARFRLGLGADVPALVGR